MPYRTPLRRLTSPSDFAAVALADCYLMCALSVLAWIGGASFGWW